ncbi:hypothetical protein IFM58399_03668 [Aspergillus lentulus]|uniref:Uncharacterized protein n=1 Tax=Aspergillus lentulus TaxID=293939 RepID=A0ABQ0ZU64_ASPLE|nr:uncharacterized protein IFM58399_03668 [Aspergillus lentulus]GFF33811.1 hypothetical protein IFM58399_03668 [Aspergillus lentulus]GFF61971.1 hypothetical protein IFM62136_05211 [Aspergillus lentulus]GFF64615.1 hypothetical protein IFM60648_01324 [Aspergillus lentulus]GFF74215.1 hypothetical protein IFM47457_03586 [Aspergillus lentulus]
MRATQLALLALAASAKLATSFEIPEGMMDGVYKVYLNENGVEVHEPLLQRISSKNHGDCDRAVQNLKNLFGGGTVRIGPNLAWYSISGSVVAFACNKVAAQAEASADRLTRALQGITERCGWYVPGTTRFVTNLWLDPYWGYMNYHPGLDFCAASTSSRSDRC